MKFCRLLFDRPVIRISYRPSNTVKRSTLQLSPTDVYSLPDPVIVANTNVMH
jgi:hypothetical protein